MRAALVDENNVVVNYVEIESFDGVTYFDPADSVFGSVLNRDTGVYTNTPPPLSAPIVPASVAMWQARDELIERGLLDAVNGALASIADPTERLRAQSKFEYSSTLRRDDPLLLQMRQALGWSDAELDDMFISAGARQ